MASTVIEICFCSRVSGMEVPVISGWNNNGEVHKAESTSPNLDRKLLEELHDKHYCNYHHASRKDHYKKTAYQEKARADFAEAMIRNLLSENARLKEELNGVVTKYHHMAQDTLAHIEFLDVEVKILHDRLDFMESTDRPAI